MKQIISIFVMVLAFTLTSNAQDKMMKDAVVKTVSLEQTKGEFTQKEITLKEGAYIFEISNNSVGHDVGFVLVKKGKDASNPENHIKSAYVTKAVGNNKKEQSNLTKLEKGSYVYFCPLNPTPEYTLTVK
ncbi:plastocyanin/azurin family copper-binding protein [Psychroserpens sp. SPM9]|uniref:plastocyanin/azurin family copper-binding protein n=1 Tax=Psychroserpens sp. SPM9 TaxID=2975598 RepID=UPI0021A60824|nr:plastocyanin/azurin family copper-binding protein [Psychroserpens sp. SPM9]MDG5490527.1 cupredoxin domain-containing protein [Psychroserpens sp. SPM9]